jgi:hypothetical protein
MPRRVCEKRSAFLGLPTKRCPFSSSLRKKSRPAGRDFCRAVPFGENRDSVKGGDGDDDIKDDNKREDE